MPASPASDLELMRASAYLDSEPATAARRASGILLIDPAHTAAKLLLAAACRRLGDAGRSLPVIEAVAAENPSVSAIQLELGRAYAALGRSEDAVSAFRRAVALDPEMIDAWRELAAQLFAAGDEAGGDQAYAHYENRARDPPGFVDVLAALSDERLDVAERLLRARLEAPPKDVVALRLYAEVATRRNDYFEAERRLEECLALAPGYAQARYDLACVYFAQQRPERVLPLIERLLRLEPRHTRVRMLKARTLRLVGRAQESVAILEALVAEQPDNDNAWVLLGHVRRELGEQAGAIEAYRRALRARPDASEAYFSLANLKTAPLGADDAEAMRRLLARTTLLPVDRVRLEFALGQTLEDGGQYEESFEHYARGNQLHRATHAYDAGAATAAVRRSQALYTAPFFHARAGWGSDRADPIFIVGVPRSGSTLLEQMLASHSAVEGTRELSDLALVIAELMEQAGARGETAYPDFVARLGPDAIAQAAAQYLQRTQTQRPLGKARFIDKMPANVNHVGLIHLMFPKAAIIDARRHPLGCGFSCYKQLFVWGAPYSYDQGELGRYIRDYVDLLAHFDAVLPGRVHRVLYERLVATPEAELKAVLDYCGLPFEAACLRFHENRRIVQSVSSEQVRRPLYAEGVDHWRHYEAWLGQLKAALGDLVEHSPGPVAASG